MDQSGGSTPTALRAYGINTNAWSSDAQMFALMHEMRSRIMTNRSFNGDRILAAILFEGTIDRPIDGQPTANYLWHKKRIVPFVKLDRDLTEEKGGRMPIVEPEVDIHCPNEAGAEALLSTALREHIDKLLPDHSVMLKLTLP